MTKLVVIIGFVVSFAAGLIVGMESRQTTVGAPVPTTSPSTRPFRGPDMLTQLLNLDSQQQEQMKKIWSEVARHGRSEQDERRRQLRTDRDNAIAALVRSEDKDKYDQIRKNYDDQMAAMNKEMRSRYDEAVKQTNEILNPDQQAKYKEFLSRHQFDRGGPGGGPGRGGPDHGGPGGPDHGPDHGLNHGPGPRDHETTRRGEFGGGGATPNASSQP